MKTLISVWSVLWLLVGLPPQARNQSPEVSTSQSAAVDSAAAKAAERKRRCEEEKQRVEGQERVQTPPCTDRKPTLYITPTEAGMLIGESRALALFDTDGHKLTATAESSVSSSYHATLTQGVEPKVTAKNERTFKVTARIDTLTAETTVKVSRSRRQQVEGRGYSSGKFCQRAPLRRIHRIPSSTRRLSIHGRPPRRFLRGFGSKGAIFFHRTSVSNGPDRPISPSSALLTLLIAHSEKLNHHSFKHLSWVMQEPLVSGKGRLVVPAKV